MTSRAQRQLLVAFLVSIGASAILALFCVVRGDIGTTETAILFTLVICALGAIFCMACLMARNRPRWRIIPIPGIVMVNLAVGFSIIGIWIELFGTWNPFGGLESLLFTMWVFAVMFVHLAVLSSARVQRRHQWVIRTTVVSSIVTACMLAVWFILWDLARFRLIPASDTLIGISGTLAGAGTLAAPLLSRLAVIQKAESQRTSSGMISICCPRCDNRVHLELGRSRCPHCGLGFNIEVEEEQCDSCGYPLYKLDSGNCPECGKPVSRPGIA